jgi:hypothetical protein
LIRRGEVSGDPFVDFPDGKPTKLRREIDFVGGHDQIRLRENFFRGDAVVVNTGLANG